jgi:hypothetical protein
MNNNNIWKSIDQDMYEDTEPHKVEYYLNWELAQCKSKTQKTLSFIALEHHKMECTTTDTKTKVISILFTNNSLIEAAAWKSRSHALFNLNNSNKNIKIRKLSSEKNSDYINCKDLKASFMKYINPKKSYNGFGDVLIMCNHIKRINDMEDFLKFLHDFDGFNAYTDYKFRFNIFFDEYDESKLYTQSLKLVQKIYHNKLSYMINAIQYISATQHPTLLSDLKRETGDNDIVLKNLIDNVGYKKDKDYKTIIDQDFIPHEGPKDPVEYVKSIHKDHPEIFKSGKVYFVPSANSTYSHEEMADLDIWKDLGLWTLILNGKNKEFRSPVGEIEKIDFTKKLDENPVELRDLLISWRKRNPTAGIAIVGKIVVQRGITFLTKDDAGNSFNFDYMFISRYFAKVKNDLIQLVGRGQGKEIYVEKFTVITQQAVWDLVNNYISDCEAITDQQPEYFDEDMLSNIGVRDPFENIEDHYELTLDNLNDWVSKNVTTKKNKPAKIKVSVWVAKEKNEDGFILHEFRKGEHKVWSVEEAKKERGGIPKSGHRIFPCYTDINDSTSLKWYVFYRV